MEELHGSIFSTSESPRAIKFKQGYKNATSLESIINLMRQNNMTAMNRANNGTEAKCEEAECIIREDGYMELGVRGDIVKQHREPYGVIDTKVVTGKFTISELLVLYILLLTGQTCNGLVITLLPSCSFKKAKALEIR